MQYCTDILLLLTSITTCIYLLINFTEKKEINPDTIAAASSGKGLCHSSGLVMKKAKNSPINTSAKS